jgi:hypothetical protein
MTELNNILSNNINKLGEKVTVDTLSKVLSDACVDSYIEGRLQMRDDIVVILMKNGVDSKIINEINTIVVSCH